MGGFYLHFRDPIIQLTGVEGEANRSCEQETAQGNTATETSILDQRIPTTLDHGGVRTRERPGVGTSSVENLPQVIDNEGTTSEDDRGGQQNSGLELSNAAEDRNSNLVRTSRPGGINRPTTLVLVVPVDSDHEDLSTGTQEGPILKDSFGKKLGTPSTRHGRQTWCLDKRNQSLANTAMDSLMEREPSLRLRSRQRNLMALQGNFWVLDATQLRLAREFGVLEHLPQISEHDLEDQNKGDALVKALAVAQSVWLIVQLLVRFAKHLPSSQLELMAAAFAGCSSFTYVLFWFKPKDAGQPRHFRATRYPTAEEVLAIAMEGPTTFFHYREGYWIPNNTVHRIHWSKNQEPDSADRYPRISFLIGSVTGAIIFGVPHLFAWNFAFPTTIERLIWRIAAVLAVVLPVVGLVVDLIFSFFYKRKARHARHAIMPGHFQRKFLSIISKIIWIFALSYFLVRIYMMVEVFRSLFYLPPRVFRTTWSSSVPHIG